MAVSKNETQEQITKRVEKLLKMAGISRLPVDVEKVASQLGVDIKYQSYDGKFSGVLIRHGDRATIGVNSQHHPNRQRFTIAHEIGHYLLHQGDLMVDKTISVNYRGNDTHIDYQKEREANLFASELLMPTKLLSKDLNKYQIDLDDEDQIKELASKYQVSQQAFMIRLAH
ncbi:MAG TPA: ImmA/IrrE family metallo-endopeptidase [bacterium]|nr:ImmA/IrrE family metallo-endopeptidase [bacterium]